MSADELRRAAETLADEWEVEDSDTAEDAAGAFTLIDMLREAADFFEGLPIPVAARALAFARVINGGGGSDD
jgi:hypothetical protein